MLLSCVLTCATVIIVGTCVLPTTAAGQVVHATAALVGKMGDALDRCD